MSTGLRGLKCTSQHVDLIVVVVGVGAELQEAVEAGDVRGRWLAGDSGGRRGDGGGHERVHEVFVVLEELLQRKECASQLFARRVH